MAGFTRVHACFRVSNDYPICEKNSRTQPCCKTALRITLSPPSVNEKLHEFSVRRSVVGPDSS